MLADDSPSHSRSSLMRPSLRWRLAGVLLTAAMAIGIAGCGSSSGSSSHSTLMVVTFEPFSGPDASFGADGDAGVIPAVGAINAAGGVLGHKLAYKNVDTRGDPADAIPAARALLANTSNIVAMVGPSSDEASATVPIFNQAGIPMGIASGQVIFNKNPYPYLWRNEPADNADGAAIAYAAMKVLHYTRAAAVFGTDISSQGSKPSAIATFEGLGGKVVASEDLSLDQPSYETEVVKVLAAHPQVIFTEADPQTTATFFGELVHAGGSVPFIGTDGTSGPPYIDAVSKAIGKARFSQLYRIVEFGTPPNGVPSVYNTAVMTYNHGVARPLSQWISNPFGLAHWDFVISVALAMEAAHSVNPKVFNPYIRRVTAASPGAVIVHSFADGVQALKAGKTIQYVGGLGPAIYNQYHNAGAPFLLQAADQTTVLDEISGTIVTNLLNAYSG